MRYSVVAGVSLGKVMPAALPTTYEMARAEVLPALLLYSTRRSAFW